MIQFNIKINDNLVLVYDDYDDKIGTSIHYPHKHNFCELYFFLEGNCSYMVENTIFKLRPGTVIFTRPGELHSVIIDEPCRYTRFFYQFHKEVFGFPNDSHLRCFFDRPIGKGNSLILPISTADECASRAKREIALYEANSPNLYAQATADFLDTLMTVNDAFDQLVNSGQLESFNPLVNSALLYINEHLAEVNSTDEVAKALFVSREYLSRSFSKEMGLTLRQYILRKKIANAKLLLSEGYPAIEAAVNSGFNNYSYFIQTFKHETGFTPNKWKKMDSKKVTFLI